MNVSRGSHPSPKVLAAFAVGKLSDGDSAAVAAHLEVCPACRRTAGSVPGESFVDHGKATQAAGNFAAPASSTVPAGGPAPVPAGLPPELAGHPRYRIVKELGRGGMGLVYQAEQTLMGRAVAIKVISKALLDHPDALERFRREIRAAAQLSHPNIVLAYEAEQAGDLHLLVMELVEGKSLAQVLGLKGSLPVAHACSYARQAALGLQHAHEKGMVHRDIKPQNLMLTRKGQVKILDFGLAKVASERRGGRGLTAVNTYMGTPDYSAPEQAADARSADIRADVYSLGCTLYCLLAGRPPFQEETDVKTILAHLEKEPPPLRGLRPDVPAELEAVVARMLAKDPARRYQTPAEAAAALAPFCKPGGGAAAVTSRVASPGRPTVVPGNSDRQAAKPKTSPVADPETEPRRPARAGAAKPAGKRWWLAGGAVAVLVAVALAALAAWQLAGVIFRVTTPAGVVVLEVEPAGAEISVDGQHRITVTGPDKDPIRIEVEEGKHELTVTKGGFVTQTKSFRVTKGEAVTLRVGLEAERQAKPKDPDPAPPAVTPKPAETARPAPPVPAGSPVVPPAGVPMTLPRNRWIELDPTTADTSSWAWGKPRRNVRNKTWENGVLSLDNGAVAFNAIQARDVSFRAQVNFIEGNNMALVVRSHHGEGGIYALFDKLDNGKMYIAVLDSKDSKVVNLKGPFFEFRVTAIGDQVTIQVNGDTVVEHRTNLLRVGHIEATAYDARGMFKDLEVKILDK
jgi:hypothetical protein